jgi:hypothetical protein
MGTNIFLPCDLSMGRLKNFDLVILTVVFDLLIVTLAICFDTSALKSYKIVPTVTRSFCGYKKWPFDLDCGV